MTVGALVLLLAIGALASDGTVRTCYAPKGTVTWDGIVSSGEWSDAPISYMDKVVAGTHVYASYPTFQLKHDGENLYVLVRTETTAPAEIDIFVCIHTPHDPCTLDGCTSYIKFVCDGDSVYNKGKTAPWVYSYDANFDGVNDGTASGAGGVGHVKYGYANGYLNAEIKVVANYTDPLPIGEPFWFDVRIDDQSTDTFLTYQWMNQPLTWDPAYNPGTDGGKLYCIGQNATDTYINVNEDNFPDDAFRTYVSNNIDTDKNGVLSTSERVSANVIYAPGLGIENLTGIAYFPNLESIECPNNRLTDLDLSKNTMLRILDVGNSHTVNDGAALNYNRLTALDVSGCQSLTLLDCSGNALTALSLNHNQRLETLICDGNALATLDVSSLSNLYNLSCSANDLTALDLSANTQLTTLNCSANALTSLDLSQNTYLNQLECSDNYLQTLSLSALKHLTTLDVTNTGLRDLDVSSNTSLTTLRCDLNELTTLDVSQNTQLQSLSCAYNLLTSLDVSTNASLLHLACDGNALHELKAGSNSRLTVTCTDNVLSASLSCGSVSVSELSGLDVTKTTNWKNAYLSADHTKIYVTAENPGYATFDYIYNTAGHKATFCLQLSHALSESNFPDATFRTLLSKTYDLDGDGALSKHELDAINYLSISGYGITSLKGVELMTSLECIDAESCGLTGPLDLSKNTLLRYLYLGSYDDKNGDPPTYQNQISSLNISGCTALEYLDCSNNLLPALNVSAATDIRILLCGGNRMTSLTLGESARLTTLRCSANSLYALDLSKATALMELDCSYNELQALDLAACTRLLHLDCSGNEITALDVNASPELMTLYCADNALGSLSVSALARLDKLDCSYNCLTSLHVMENPVLTELYCHHNALNSLNVSANAALTTLACDENELFLLDVSSNKALLSLSCDGNELHTLDVSANKALTYLSCSYNHLPFVELANNIHLFTFNCVGNTVTVSPVNSQVTMTAVASGFDTARAWDWAVAGKIDNAMLDANGVLTIPTNASSVEYIYRCGTYYTAIFSLNVELGDFAINETTFADAFFREYVASNFDLDGDGILSGAERKAVIYIDVSDMSIRDLTGIEAFTSLEGLDCSGNSLSGLDLSGNPALMVVNASNNVYNVKSSAGIVKLSDLSPGFDVSKALAWSGATLNEDGTLTMVKGEDTVTYTYMCTENYSTTITLLVTPDIVVSADLNEDGEVDRYDMIYLGRHLLRPSRYPIPEGVSADFNSDGVVDRHDMIYLGRHLLRPSRYPIPKVVASNT